MTGLCRICGDVTELSFEHVPPRAAFNNRRTTTADISRLIGSDDPNALEQPARGHISQRGAGAYTLCVKCNNTTGHWYGSAYVDWAAQGLMLLQASGRSPSLYHIFHIFPLRVLKQIICMFFSANSPNFRDRHEDLVRFVLNRDAKYLDPKVRVYAFYHLGDRSRQSGVSTLVQLSDDGFSARSKIFSEITWPPFGYVLSLDSEPPDDDLLDISGFAHYRYKEWTDVQLRLRAKEIYSWLPGDYRSREEVRETFRANVEQRRRLRDG